MLIIFLNIRLIHSKFELKTVFFSIPFPFKSKSFSFHTLSTGNSFTFHLFIIYFITPPKAPIFNRCPVSALDILLMHIYLIFYYILLIQKIN